MGKILLIGDPIVDVYLQGRGIAPAPETPLRVRGDESVAPGGACNLGCNLLSLGADLIFCAVSGGGAQVDVLRGCFRELGMPEEQIFFDAVDGPALPTRVRILDHRQVFARHDTHTPWRDGAADEYMRHAFDRAVAAYGDDVFMVVVSDYGGGLITPGVMALVHAWADPRNVNVVFQGRSCAGTASRFCGNWALVLNAAEFAELGFTLGGGNIQPARLEHASRVLNCQNVVVTLGRDGALWCGRREHGWEHASYTPRVVELDDPVGCGDTFLAALCIARNEGYAWPTVLAMASVAGASAAARLGAVHLTKSTWMAALGRSVDSSFKIIGAAMAATAAVEAHAVGRRVGVVNGCFDVLHPGHLAVIADAAQHAHAVFVLVATSGHVRRLKGDDRPFQTMDWRATNLTALQDVDFVVPFHDEVQLGEIINMIQPDVMTKGEEYRGTAIVGADVVNARGGTIRFVSVPGCSTSAFAARVRGEGGLPVAF